MSAAGGEGGARWRIVVGSYPPVPGPAAAASVAAVRRAWDAGAEVVVASPRPSAAPHVLAPVAGCRGLGRELTRLRRDHGCDEVVVCIEPGWPLSGRRPERSGHYLAGALGRFGHAELVVTGSPTELGKALAGLSVLWPVVAEVTACSDELAAALRAAGAPAVRTVEPFSGAGLGTARATVTAGAVGPLEPAELLLVARARRAAGTVARRVLGPRAPAVRAWVGARLGGARLRGARLRGKRGPGAR